MRIKMIVTLFMLSILGVSASGHAAEFGESSATINNLFLPARIGNSYLMTGYGDRSFQYGYTNLFGTDIVDGVKCVKLISIRTEASEFTEAWIAQDVLGAVYILKYWDGSESSPVVLGKTNAALYMPRAPRTGDAVLGGDSTVVAVGVTVPMLRTGLGPFTNCLKIMEPDGDIVYFAPHVGEVKKEYSGQSGWELKEVFNTPSRTVVLPLLD
jgi:hypothetical protein